MCIRDSINSSSISTTPKKLILSSKLCRAANILCRDVYKRQGIYTKSGNARVMLIEKIKKELPVDKIIFEAPQKNQQVYFIKEFGTNVNLGNVAYQDVIALETLRLGLRGDTFFDFLPENYEEYKQK